LLFLGVFQNIIWPIVHSLLVGLSNLSGLNLVNLIVVDLLGLA